MAATNMAFAEPATTQQASPLMRLPAELRLNILDILLSHATTIAPKSSHPTLTGFAQRSAQLLQACQQLYCEGHAILYKNVVAIRFEKLFHYCYCHVLNAIVDLTTCLPVESRIEQPSLLDAAQARVRRGSLSRPIEAERFIQLYPVLV